MGITVRDYRPADAEALGAIYTRAVREGTRGHYDARQRRVWAEYWPGGGSWEDRLRGFRTWVAEADRAPVGFMSLGQGGHLELAFVLPDWMGRGVADALYDALEAEARARGLTRLDTEASHLARRFFLRRGWREIARKDKLHAGVILTNYRMEKRLPG